MITRNEKTKLFEVKLGGLTVFFKSKKAALNWLALNPVKESKPKKTKKVIIQDFTGRNFAINQSSANSKLSTDRSFATVSGSHNTCPTNCAFIKTANKSNGCYGDNHGINFHFDAIGVKKGLNLNELQDKLNCLPIGQKIRFFDVGDVPNHDTVMDIDIIKVLNDAVKLRKLKPIQFTHNVINYSNVEIAKKLHYVLNFSCETIQQAKKAIDSGVNAVLVVPSNTERVKSRHVDGLNLVTCPSQWIDLKLSKKEITCSTCMMCSKDRVKQKNVVVFYSHGTGYKKIDNALNLINSKG